MSVFLEYRGEMRESGVNVICYSRLSRFGLWCPGEFGGKLCTKRSAFHLLDRTNKSKGKTKADRQW